jgi:hypothetical protein
MRQSLLLLAGILMTASLFISCQDDNASSENLVSKQVLDQISHLGYSTENVQKIEEGYLVEGDIILTEENLQDHNDHISLRIAESEQYNTNNLVTGLPRAVVLSMDAQLTNTPGYVQAVNEIVARYNAQSLGLTFSYNGATSGGTIHFKKQPGNYLASAGFPTSNGNPYSLVKLNSNAIGQGTSNTFINYCATIMAHEVGHCIGFRHTDWMDRSYSCGTGGSEGAGSVGAILIPGTPAGPDAGSWMLACISNNQNRPFNGNDVTALKYLY